jgi:hypothetical protein
MQKVFLHIAFGLCGKILFFVLLCRFMYILIGNKILSRESRHIQTHFLSSTFLWKKVEPKPLTAQGAFLCRAIPHGSQAFAMLSALLAAKAGINRLLRKSNMGCGFFAVFHFSIGSVFAHGMKQSEAKLDLNHDGLFRNFPSGKKRLRSPTPILKS